MRIGIKRKLLAVFLAGFIVTVAAMGWIYFVMQGLVGTVVEMEEISKKVEWTGHLSVEIQRLLTDVQDYIITGEVGKRDDFDATVMQLSGVFKELEAYGGDEMWRSVLREIKVGTEDLVGLAVEVMYVEEPVGNTAAAELMITVSAWGEKVVTDVERFHGLAELTMRGIQHEVTGRTAQTGRLMYTLPLIGFLLLLMLYYYVHYGITRPLLALSRGADAISKGEFEHRVVIETGDEIEGLAKDFTRMAVILKERETRLKSVLKVVDKMNREIMNVSKYKSTFLSNMSDELKTPLTHIIGFSELLKDEAGAALSDNCLKYVENIYESGHDLRVLINDLFEFSRTDRMIAIDVKEVSVPEVVKEVVEKIIPGTEMKNQEFTFEVQSGLKTIWADREMFRQMLLNVLSNAVKFTPRSGRISMRVTLTYELGTPALKVIVQDTGIGIKEAEMESLFKPFEVRSTMSEYGGLGVGLALTRKFVEYHGGKIWIDSSEGKGTTVTFIILTEPALGGKVSGVNT